jgi:hypothetical protein
MIQNNQDEETKKTCLIILKKHLQVAAAIG